MIHYFYNLDCPERLLVHAKVHALAEKYAIDGLKSVAIDKFRHLVEFCDYSDDFWRAAGDVYTSTVEHDRGLRDIVVESINYYLLPGVLDPGSILDEIRNNQALTFDLLIRVLKRVRSSESAE